MSRKKAGFTLVEMLCTIVIMLLVSAAATLGIQIAVENYSKSILNSEAQVLCATVSDIVCDELRFSKDAQWDGSTLVFTDMRENANRVIEVTDGKVYRGYAQGRINATSEKLLPDSAYPNNLAANVELTQGSTADRVVVTVNVYNSAAAQEDRAKALSSRSTEVELLNPGETS